jgi:hypothetical protein
MLTGNAHCAPLNEPFEAPGRPGQAGNAKPHTGNRNKSYYIITMQKQGSYAFFFRIAPAGPQGQDNGRQQQAKTEDDQRHKAIPGPPFFILR